MRMRSGTSGNDPNLQAQVQAMLGAAVDMESSAEMEVSRAIRRNVDVLRAAWPPVTDEMWTAIGIFGGASGLVAIAGWGDPYNPETEQYLDHLRQLYQAALDNRAAGVPRAFQ
jgi:hypothetical protein